MIQEQITGSDIFFKMNEKVPHKYAELNLEVWSPTPWMIDVFTKGREHQIRNWCLHNLGNESSPIHNKSGSWHEANVTMFGYCWYGFSSKELMNRFLENFQSPPKPTVN